jgi:hypothetical protein
MNEETTNIILGITGGVLTTIFIELFKQIKKFVEYRNIAKLSGLYKVSHKGRKDDLFWIRVDVNDMVLDLRGGRNFSNLDDVTIEGQVYVHHAKSYLGHGYYIDIFDMTDRDYIGNGKLHLNFSKRDKIEATSNYFTNETIDGKTSTVMVRQVEIWNKWK